MSEAQNTEATPQAPAQEQPDSTPEATTVEETDWKAEARKWEQRAKENKSAADELATIKDAQKSEAERAADALATAQAEATQARAELLRYRIAASHGITDSDDIALFLTGTDEDTLTKQAQRLAERSQSAGQPRTPQPDPNQGQGASQGGTPEDQFVAWANRL